MGSGSASVQEIINGFKSNKVAHSTKLQRAHDLLAPDGAVPRDTLPRFLIPFCVNYVTKRAKAKGGMPQGAAADDIAATWDLLADVLPLAPAGYTVSPSLVVALRPLAEDTARAATVARVCDALLRDELAFQPAAEPTTLLLSTVLRASTASTAVAPLLRMLLRLVRANTVSPKNMFALLVTHLFVELIGAHRAHAADAHVPALVNELLDRVLVPDDLLEAYRVQFTGHAGATAVSVLFEKLATLHTSMDAPAAYAWVLRHFVRASRHHFGAEDALRMPTDPRHRVGVTTAHVLVEWQCFAHLCSLLPAAHTSTPVDEPAHVASAHALAALLAVAAELRVYVQQEDYDDTMHAMLTAMSEHVCAQLLVCARGDAQDAVVVPMLQCADALFAIDHALVDSAVFAMLQIGWARAGDATVDAVADHVFDRYAALRQTSTAVRHAFVAARALPRVPLAIVITPRFVTRLVAALRLLPHAQVASLWRMCEAELTEHCDTLSGNARLVPTLRLLRVVTDHLPLVEGTATTIRPLVARTITHTIAPMLRHYAAGERSDAGAVHTATLGLLGSLVHLCDTADCMLHSHDPTRADEAAEGGAAGGHHAVLAETVEALCTSLHIKRSPPALVQAALRLMVLQLQRPGRRTAAPAEALLGYVRGALTWVRKHAETAHATALWRTLVGEDSVGGEGVWAWMDEDMHKDVAAVVMRAETLAALRANGDGAESVGAVSAALLCDAAFYERAALRDVLLRTTAKRVWSALRDGAGKRKSATPKKPARCAAGTVKPAKKRVVAEVDAEVAPLCALVAAFPCAYFSERAVRTWVHVAVLAEQLGVLCARPLLRHLCTTHVHIVAMALADADDSDSDSESDSEGEGESDKDVATAVCWMAERAAAAPDARHSGDVEAVHQQVTQWLLGRDGANVDGGKAARMWAWCVASEHPLAVETFARAVLAHYTRIASATRSNGRGRKPFRVHATHVAWMLEAEARLAPSCVQPAARAGKRRRTGADGAASAALALTPCQLHRCALVLDWLALCQRDQNVGTHYSSRPGPVVAAVGALARASLEMLRADKPSTTECDACAAFLCSVGAAWRWVGELATGSMTTATGTVVAALLALLPHREAHAQRVLASFVASASREQLLLLLHGSASEMQHDNLQRAWAGVCLLECVLTHVRGAAHTRVVGKRLESVLPALAAVGARVDLADADAAHARLFLRVAAVARGVAMREASLDLHVAHVAHCITCVSTPLLAAEAHERVPPAAIVAACGVVEALFKYRARQVFVFASPVLACALALMDMVAAHALDPALRASAPTGAEALARCLSEAAHHKMQLRKYGAFLVEHYVHVQEHRGIDPSVAEPLSRAVFHVMDVCTDYDFQHLHSAQGDTGKELFRRLHAAYVQRHKFVGEK